MILRLFWLVLRSWASRRLRVALTILGITLGVAVASHQDPRAARWVGQQLPSLAIWVWPATVSEANEQGLLSWFEGLLQDLLKRS